MATIKSTRILALQAVSPRLVPLPLPASTPISGTSPGGSTLGAVSATAASGLSTAQLAQTAANTASGTAGSALVVANSAFAGLSTKLDATSNYVLQGDWTLSSAGHGMYTSGYASGNGVAFTDYGLVMRSGGVTMVSIPAYGSPTFAGVVDCGNGAVVRTPNLASSGSVELIKIQLQNGNQFGKLVQYGDTFGSGGFYPGMGWEYNFSGASCTLMGIADTSSGYSSRLVLSANGTVWLGTFINGVLQAAANIARCNNINQSGLDADKLDGRHASDFSLFSHNHAGVYADYGHAHSGVYSPVGHNHTIESLSPSATSRHCAVQVLQNGVWTWLDAYLWLW